jgi:hypothetical protein
MVKKHLKLEDYKNALFNEKNKKHVMRYFRSENHEISTVVQNKTSLSINDDKRFILEGGVKTLAYGHWRIVNIVDQNLCNMLDSLLYED